MCVHIRVQKCEVAYSPEKESVATTCACTSQRSVRLQSPLNSSEVRSAFVIEIGVGTLREGFFLVPVSPPVRREGNENRDFFSGRVIL